MVLKTSFFSFTVSSGLWSVLIVLCFTACSETRDPDPSLVGYSYFPLETNTYIDYEVMEETFFTDGSMTVENYFLRRHVADSFQTQAGYINYVIYRYRRDSEIDPWEYIDTWSARREENRAVTAEGNIPFISVSFPVRNGLRWDGNGLNSLSQDMYTLDSLAYMYSIPGTEPKPSLTVIQEDLFDLVIEEQDRRYEIYMEGVGLVERGITRLDLCTGAGCPSNSIESGTRYIQKAIGYGRE